MRKVLQSILNEYHERVYFQEADKNATYPYVVYDLPTSFFMEGVEVFNLDADIWSDKDTSEFESLTNAIWNGLDNLTHNDDNLFISIYKENRLALNESDSKIKRRKLIFQLRYIDREV